MGSKENSETSMDRESFLLWFSETENHYNQHEQGDPLLYQQRKITRIKKYAASFADSDIFLELAEDKRRGLDFVMKNKPLEAAAILGGLSLFHYLIDETSGVWRQYLIELNGFANAYETKDYCRTDYLEAIRKVIQRMQQGKLEEGKGEDNGEMRSAMKSIKVYFLYHIALNHNDTLFPSVTSVLEEISEIEDEHLKIQKFTIQRHLRIIRNGHNKYTFSDFSKDKRIVEDAFRLLQADDNPCLMLAKCQLLENVLSCNGPEDLQLGEDNFRTHSEIVSFIKRSAETISRKYPTFLQARFVFAEMFANTLPITRHDKAFASSLLIEAFQDIPLSSRISHKLGLCLIKTRQFSESLKYIQNAANLDPQNIMAYHSLAKLLLRDVTLNKDELESLFTSEMERILEIVGSENELLFWKGCYFFKLGDTEVAVNIWGEIILEFYMTKPDLDLETVLPFRKLSEASATFLWTKNSLTLEAVGKAVKDAASKEKTRRRVVFHRLQDLVNDAINNA